MRTYKLEMRIIQVAVIVAALVVVTGFMGGNIWGEQKAAPQVNVPTKTENTVSKSTTPTAPTNPKIIALGDSFTIGYPAGTDKSWTSRLAEDLQVPVINKGLGHQTAKDLLSRFNQDVVSQKPGRVIIFVGDGDALQNESLKDFQSYIEAMVEKAQANHIEPILALPLPYPGVQSAIQEMRAWELSYAQSQKIVTLDFASVLFDDKGNFLSGLAAGSKYPNYPSAKGYEAMGDYAARILK